jgi:hypothetical protein
VDQVQLEHSPGCRTAVLREITGIEEQQVSGTTTVDAVQLLEPLIVEMPGSLQRNDLVRLTACDRDRVLAVIYSRIYGSRVDSSATCVACGEIFDLHFDLADLMDTLLSSTETELTQTQTDRSYLLPEGIRFRLPTAEDELSVIGMSQEDAEKLLLQRCMLTHEIQDMEKDAEGFLTKIQSEMAALAPLVDTELDAKCPECSHTQQIHFDLQHFLLQALCNERDQLMRDLHILASAYGWGLNEITGLARSQRKSLVAMVEMDETLKRVE